MYGQQLKAEFEARTGSVWPLNVGQVYTSLDRLERDGLVEAAPDPGGSPTRPYTLTPEGQVELDLWMRTASPIQATPRDDLVMKVMIAISIVPDESGAILQSHRRQLIERMRELTHMKASPNAGAALLLMCDAELFRIEAMVRWLDSVEARLRAGAITSADPQSESTPADQQAPTDRIDQQEHAS
jgi:DNA-binding PadR family transcriptional regulator